jgi:hypothetical protein
LDPNATTIEAISLMNGNAAALTLITANILTNGSIPVSDLQYNWTIPANLTSGQDCKLSNSLLFEEGNIINRLHFFTVDVLTMRGNNSYVTYSSFFSIVNNNTTTNNTTQL